MIVEQHVGAHVSAHIDVLAHHMLLLAIPAFFPAVAVVGVVIWIAVRDRRTHDDTTTPERNGNPK
jgi:hypothetical protein